MNEKKYILAIDQGTSSTKTILFDEEGKAVAKGYEPLKSYFLEGGFVEQDPQEIYNNVLTSVEKCIDGFKSNGGDLPISRHVASPIKEKPLLSGMKRENHYTTRLYGNANVPFRSVSV